MPRARSKPKKRKQTLTEEKILEVGRKHFAEDFPNPERKGCPPTNQLKLLTDNPRKANQSVLNHISTCSPCYRTYSQLLRMHKAKRRSRAKQ